MRKTLLALPLLLVLLSFDTAAQTQDASGKVFWRGMVDDKLHLVIKGDKLEHKTISGQAKPDGVYSFTAALPERAVTVSVLRIEGRSKKIAVVQQPTAENGFTAIVEIWDQGGGAREYRLEISWR
jgi:hypothetical protein